VNIGLLFELPKPAGNVTADNHIATNGSFLWEILRKVRALTTFKKPLKPPLLLFDLFAQSEPARHERFCGVRKNFDPNQKIRLFWIK
jgi:hypothetical protein